MRQYRVVIDLDGTVCDDAHRHAWAERGEFDEYHRLMMDDAPFLPMVHLVRTLWNSGWDVVIMTTRPEQYRQPTISWLLINGVPYNALLMRPYHDTRLSAELKLGWARQYDHITMVYEDRDVLVDAWRAAGYFCLQPQRRTD